MNAAGRVGGLVLCAALGASGGARAADPDSVSMRDHTHMDRASMAHSAMHQHAAWPGMYGRYAFTREASGTAWQPQSALHEGLHVERGPWMLMLHGWASLVYDRQAGVRGDEDVFGGSMLMGLARRALGPGALGLRLMMSAEPATVGREGYPLLLQTGESADGRTRLIDRQHPHDLFMELAGAYSVADATRSAFVYAGLPGEPALGPPVFMHRFSGEAFPDAPITHHWLDSTHITYGVVTLGVAEGGLKLEASSFRGREPDEARTDFETPKLDSHSFRLSWNPGPEWALQASFGRLHSPEQLEPEVDTDRATASAIWNRGFERGRVQGTLAWGRNRNRPGRILDALLLEGAARIGERHTALGRAEVVGKDELFAPGDPRAGRPFTVGRASAGYAYDFSIGEPITLGLGALASVSMLPPGLRDSYGEAPLSTLVFVRARLR